MTAADSATSAEFASDSASAKAQAARDQVERCRSKHVFADIAYDAVGVYDVLPVCDALLSYHVQHPYLPARNEPSLVYMTHCPCVML